MVSQWSSICVKRGVGGALLGTLSIRCIGLLGLGGGSSFYDIWVGAGVMMGNLILRMSQEPHVLRTLPSGALSCRALAADLWTKHRVQQRRGLWIPCPSPSHACGLVWSLQLVMCTALFHLWGCHGLPWSRSPFYPPCPGLPNPVYSWLPVHTLAVF